MIVQLVILEIPMDRNYLEIYNIFQNFQNLKNRSKYGRGPKNDIYLYL